MQVNTSTLSCIVQSSNVCLRHFGSLLDLPAAPHALGSRHVARQTLPAKPQEPRTTTRSISSQKLRIVTAGHTSSTPGLTGSSAPVDTMPGGLSRLMDKGRHHFNKTLSPSDDAYLSCEFKCKVQRDSANVVRP